MIGKKSKYRNCVINKKRYYFYKIVWIDILGDTAHATVEEFDRYETSGNDYTRICLLQR
jgi:hypothetical protein